MFGMGFMEIFLVLIVAVMALGPEKLPSAAVDMVKFFKKFKSSIDDAKSTIDNELNISQMKEEADKFKASINEVKGIANLDINDISHLDDDDEPKEIKPKEQIVKTEIKAKEETIVETSPAEMQANVSFKKEATV